MLFYKGKYDSGYTTFGNTAKVINIMTTKKQKSKTYTQKEKLKLLRLAAKRILIEVVLGGIMLLMYAAVMAALCGIMVSMVFPSNFVGYAISCGGLGTAFLMVNYKVYDRVLYLIGPKYPGKY